MNVISVIFCVDVYNVLIFCVVGVILVQNLIYFCILFVHFYYNLVSKKRKGVSDNFPIYSCLVEGLSRGGVGCVTLEDKIIIGSRFIFETASYNYKASWISSKDLPLVSGINFHIKKKEIAIITL